MKLEAFALSLAVCSAVASAAAPAPAFAGVWGTQNGQVHIQIQGNTVTGIYKGRANHSSDFRFTCQAPSPDAASGSWQFVQPSGGQNSGSVNLRLVDSGQLHMVMRYADGKPMLDTRLRKVEPAVFQGNWATQNGIIRISRAANTLNGSYQGRKSSEGNFSFTCTLAGETRATGNWVFPDGSNRGPIALTLQDGQMRIVMTYANGKPMLDATVNKAP